ncbi:Protein of unknown function [Ruminococcus sp. YE71]|uniref:DUF2752 domain-containing protein n=1 Tax=unclassified Ruminococcus TaxID=2608920 RepID=UPI000889E1CA|nr:MULTISPECIES: DUF2752 domain-containing protein [unclassified Ruminococcus]SDA24182.1 Protein of unknown function [Ruminococcus sp. YE78]SFW41527.1 Protein of unknown function [Ruminococcus sp. YE71]
MKKRIIRVLFVYAAIASSAAAYALIMELTGRGLPCIFHKLTGLKCPGCGNTHALHCLATGRFREALGHNAMMPLEAAFAVWLAVASAARYIRTGKYSLTTGCEAANVVFLLLFVGWWVVRNILGI